MADILPECLIQKILCFLRFKEAIKMSVLSKTWLQASSTLPNLEFAVDYSKRNMKIVDNIMEKYREGKIPIDKFKLLYSGDSLEVIDKWLDIALQNSVKDLVFTSSRFRLPIFKILASKSLRELDMWGCYLMPVSLSSGVVNCNSLRKLSLSFITLDENMLQTLLNSCPSIVSIIIEHCSWLEKIEQLNLQKIKSVSLKVLKIRYCEGIWEIDAPNLVSLEYTWNKIPQLKIVRESRQLQHSKIVLHCNDNLDDAWFCKLRKFLSNSTSWSQVRIDLPTCSEINMKDLQLHFRGSSPQVDVLNVNIVWLNKEYPTFVDALLLSFHPRRLQLNSSIEIITWFISHLMYMKNSSHSTSHRSKPGHSQLKEVKAFDGKNQSLQLGCGELAVRTLTERKTVLGTGELAVRTLTEREKVYFLLDW